MDVSVANMIEHGCIYSKDNLIYKVNNKFLELVAYKQSDIIGKSMKDLSILLKNDFQVCFDDMVGTHNIYLITNTGLAVDVTISLERFEKDNIKVYYVKENKQVLLRHKLLSFEDLTINNKHALALFSYPAAICLKTNINYHAYLDRLNIKMKHPVGKPYPYPAYLSKFSSFIEEGGCFYEDQVEFTSPDGITTYWDMNMKLVLGDEGKTYLMLSLYDVSDRLNEKKRHDKERVEMELILDRISDVITTVNNKGEFTYINKAGIDKLSHHIPIANLLDDKVQFGLFTQSNINGDELSYEETPIQRVLRGESVMNEIIVGISHLPTTYHECIGIPTYDSLGNIDGGILTYRDIGDRIQAEEARLLEETLEIQNQMFSTISHELKTPLNIIFSASQLIEMYLHEELNDQSKEAMIKNIKMIKQNCYRFTKIINNIIDLSSMECGFYTVCYNTINVVKYIEDIIDSMRSYIQDKGLFIIFDTEIEEKNISVDVEKLERILLNLISNAVKFSYKNNTIYVAIKDKGDCIEIHVRDWGIGINKKHLNTIFNKYSKLEDSLAQNAEGSGIGLALVKNLVELIGGTIRVESEVNKGSLFVVSLPVKQLDESEVATTINPEQLANISTQINIELSDIYAK